MVGVVVVAEMDSAAGVLGGHYDRLIELVRDGCGQTIDNAVTLKELGDSAMVGAFVDSSAG